jgi:hypothetical protein
MGKNKVRMTPESNRKFNRKMKALARFVKPNKGFSKLLAGMGTDIIRRSSRKVPVDTGTLKQSVYLEGKPFSIEVGYNADYDQLSQKLKRISIRIGQYKYKKNIKNERRKPLYKKRSLRCT